VVQAENLLGTVASMLGTVVNAGSPVVEGELPLDGNRFEGSSRRSPRLPCS